MLIILYGATVEVGKVSRDYLTEKGYVLIRKYNYASEKPKVSTYFGGREYVDKETFYKNTDSLFRYEMAGINIGFNQHQISDAVCNKSNALLTLSAPNIDFLKEIKRVYADNVCLIYTYIDEATLEKITRDSHKDTHTITEDEVSERLRIGAKIKQNYAQNPVLFDKVVIYSGEKSAFNKENLKMQYEAIIKSLSTSVTEQKNYADVFISYIEKDKYIYSEIAEELTAKGISFYSEQNDILFGQNVNNDYIRHAKAVILIVTGNSLASEFVSNKICLVMDAAENNGTMIIPFFVGDLRKYKNNLLFQMLSTIWGVIADTENIDKYASEVALRIQKIFTVESSLKELSQQVENYLSLKMCNQAFQFQKAHLAYCDEVFSLFGGKYPDIEVCLLSREKLISILLDMDNPQEALEYVISALNLADEDSQTLETLYGQFAICCVRCNMSEDEVRELIKNRLNGAKFVEGEFYLPKGEQYLNNIVEYYQEEKKNLNVVAYEEAVNSNTNEGYIALYGEQVMDLFDNLLKSENEEVSNHDLIIGYERILNYCKHIGLKGDIADKCIKRINEIKSNVEKAESAKTSDFSESLKIYLGQVLPMSGKFDVFISYCSEDKILAKKVNDYLILTGKEVFFAPETLSQIGKSEYGEVIDEAVVRSKHMVLVSSNPEYFKRLWIDHEWRMYHNETLEGRKGGNIILVLSDDVSQNKDSLPLPLRDKEIIKMSEFRSRLLSYLR